MEILKKIVLNWKNHIHAFIITIITFASLTSLSFLNLIYLDPFPKVANFEFSDIYNLLIYARKQPKDYSKIVLVSVDGLNRRDEIAGVLKEVNECHPKAIGMDIIFSYPLDETTDSILVNTIDQTDNIVIPYILKTTAGDVFKTKESNYFIDSLKNRHEGFVNFTGNQSEVIRRFTARERYQSDEQVLDTVYSFAAQLVGLYDKNRSPKEIQQTGNISRLINYYPLDFLKITYEEIDEYKKILRDKIVIIGYSSDDDNHHTPMLIEMSGMEIHAYILATMLENKYIRDINNWGVFLSGFVICYLFSFACFVILRRINSGSGFIIRIIQTTLLILCLIAGYYLYIYLRINVHYVMLLLAIGFTSFFTDIYCGILYWSKKINLKLTKDKAIE